MRGQGHFVQRRSMGCFKRSESLIMQVTNVSQCCKNPQEGRVNPALTPDDPEGLFQPKLRFCDFMFSKLSCAKVFLIKS